jgi:NAD(P)-dependent dehydrogenase (short-subunit alcohol dehydrogenase family)
MTHPVFEPGRTAVITGAASGIGLAAARRLVGLGLNVVMADRDGEALAAAADSLGSDKVAAEVADVAKPEDLQRLQAVAAEAFGEINLLMNNAATGQNPGKPWENAEGWRDLLAINLMGVINGVPPC